MAPTEGYPASVPHTAPGPVLPGSPSLVTLMPCPSCTPRGILILTTLFLGFLPVPLHFLQGLVIISPVPLHFGQGETIWKKPPPLAT